MIVEFRGQEFEMPDDANPDQIKKFLMSQGGAQQPMQGVQGGASMAQAPPPPSMIERGAGMLPGIGGMIGGLVPGPMGIPTAALGQGLGQMVNETITGNVGDGSGVNREMAKGAAFAAAGGTIGKGIGLANKGLYAAGAHVSPKIAKTLLKYGVSASEGSGMSGLKAFGKQGQQRLDAVFTKVSDKARAAYAKADSQLGKNIKLSEVTDSIRKMAKKPEYGLDEKAALEKIASRIDKNFDAYVDPSGLRAVKQGLQRKANYTGDRIGPLTKEANKKAAAAAQGKLRGLGAVGKEIAKHDDELGDIIEARRKLGKNVKNFVPGRGHGPLQPVTGLLDNPQVASTIALLLNATKGTANQGTRAAGNLVFPPSGPRE